MSVGITSRSDRGADGLLNNIPLVPAPWRLTVEKSFTFCFIDSEDKNQLITPFLSSPDDVNDRLSSGVGCVMIVRFVV